MTRQCVFSLAFAILAAAVPPAYSQASCTLATPTPPPAASNGEAERVEDIAMTCTSSAPSESILINVQVTLNVNITSRIENTTTLANEALLLIDEPLPGVPNISNGFSYFGQVLGTPGILAGSPGSGNVYQGMQVSSGGVVDQRAVIFEGVPYVTGGTRIFRINNVRADVASIGINPIAANVDIITNVAVGITNPVITVAVGADPLHFTFAPLPGAPGWVLTFAETYDSAFRKRDENTVGGPLTLNHQDVPGKPYCTESGFIPGFEALTHGVAGLADTGVRLLSVFTALPASVTSLTVPNQATSSSGLLVAHRVLPPFGPTFALGTVNTATGDSTVPVTSTHTAELLYDVTAAAPFLGVNGCAAMDIFTIGVIPSPSTTMPSPTVKGYLAPIDNFPEASAAAPLPRFMP
jgi:hypothetical protein